MHEPIQAPKEYIQRCEATVPAQFMKRRIFCGMVAALDDAIFTVTDRMQQLEMWKQTLFGEYHTCQPIGTMDMQMLARLACFVVYPMARGLTGSVRPFDPDLQYSKRIMVEIWPCLGTITLCEVASTYFFDGAAVYARSSSCLRFTL